MRTLLSLTLALVLSGASAAGTLVVGAEGEPESLDPGSVSGGTSTQVQRMMYDGLVRFRPGTADLAPGLALSWSSNPDATQWTFKLRPGVKFHDGTPFNAEAVVFNVNRWWDAKDASGFRDQGKNFEIWAELMGGFKGDPNSVLKRLVRVDNLTVRFELGQSLRFLPDILGSSYFGLASPAAVARDGARYGTPASHPAGTGMFSFDSWRSGDRVVLKANPAYWGQKPKLDGVVVRFLKEPSARLNELRAGTIDVTANLNPDDLKAVQGDTSLNAVLQPSFNVGFLSLNVRHPALQNDKVRRAISLAVNKKALVTAFYGGLGQSDASFLPPPLAWANSGTVPADYTYDPVLARRLLSEAGFPNGFALTLWYMPVSRPYFPTPKPFAEGIAADLSAVGIKVTLKTEDWAIYLKDRNKPPYFDMYMIGWGGDYGDPDNFYSAYYGKNASEDSGYRLPLIDQLLDQGRAATSRAEKTRVYARLHDLTYAANVRLPMVHSRPLAASRSYVRNWITGPLGNYDDLNLVDLSGKK